MIVTFDLIIERIYNLRFQCTSSSLIFRREFWRNNDLFFEQWSHVALDRSRAKEEWNGGCPLSMYRVT